MKSLKTKSVEKTLQALMAGFTALTLTACGNANLDSQIGAADPEDSNIVNGAAVVAADLEAKSTVGLYLLEIDAKGKPTGNVSAFCTGTLIAPTIVLSAAHCFADFAAEVGVSVEKIRQLTVVGFGLASAKKINQAGSQFRAVKALAVHPEYKVDSVQTAEKIPMKDVSILKLASAAPAGYVPANLPAAQPLKSGTIVSIAGYGLLKASLFGSVEATKLMKVNVPVDNADFSATQFNYKLVAGKSACSGDSGGPAFMKSTEAGKLVVVGITSWGDQLCQSKGVYTKVSAFKEWITATTKALLAKP